MGFSHSEGQCYCTSRRAHVMNLAGEVVVGDTRLTDALKMLSRTACRKGSLAGKVTAPVRVVREFVDALNATSEMGGN